MANERQPLPEVSRVGAAIHARGCDRGDIETANPDAGLATAIAEMAARDDPSLPVAVGTELALTALAGLRQNSAATPGALARHVLEQHPDTDVSWANHVARSTLLIISRL